MSRKDRFTIFFVTLALLLGYSMQFITSFAVGVFVLILALSSMLAGLILLMKMDSVKAKSANTVGYGNLEEELDLSILKRRLSWQLLVSLPSFPLVYILSATKVIDHNVYLVAIMVCNVSTKIIFAAILMCAHVEVLYTLFVAETNINAAKRRFVRYIMHEVRVPLSSVVMGINVMENCGGLSDEERDTLVMMKGATDFMRETLNDILCMQKIEEGKLELTFAPFILADVVKSVKLSLRGLMSDRNIRLKTIIDEALPEQVVGDRFRVEHVLANLLSNAIKFSPIGGRIFINISAGSVVESPRTSTSGGVADSEIRLKTCDVKFSVRDEGPGIAKEDQKKLFSAFFQIRPGEVQQGGGSGVGLSICKQIVELHGGSISCESEIGLGSTFSFIIPFQVRDSTHDQSEHHSSKLAKVICPATSLRLPQPTGGESSYAHPNHIAVSMYHILVVDGKSY